MGRMAVRWAIAAALCSQIFGRVHTMQMSSNYFCADMNPQSHIIIDQLMGMWYGIEIYNHVEERHYNKVVPSCPIIHLSEDQHPQTTTFNPLHRNYNYGYNYGEGHGQYYNHRTTQGRIPTDYHTNPTNYHRSPQEQLEFDRNTTYPNYRQYDHHGYMRKLEYDMRRLRLYWDENGSSTEYHLRYNITKPGFWISEGPQNGSSLEPQFSHFAGTIQVLKAVGSHLLLTFCHQLPERQLYSVLLARENKLNYIESNGVHSMLHRRGLAATAVKKVCSGSRKLTGVSLFSLLIGYLLWNIIL
ncbi:uncharacterized protein LOC109596102 [Aethina tumida]|uniref:uncharacterized protein LOC109596102 n=1 Tax=Aethina tumida TaxID=116153 RepID=UPI00096B0BD2|nr:uncharacterized protein LOC109596102 [Aethina tumida]